MLLLYYQLTWWYLPLKSVSFLSLGAGVTLATRIGHRLAMISCASQALWTRKLMLHLLYVESLRRYQIELSLRIHYIQLLNNHLFLVHVLLRHTAISHTSNMALIQWVVRFRHSKVLSTHFWLPLLHSLTHLMDIFCYVVIENINGLWRWRQFVIAQHTTLMSILNQAAQHQLLLIWLILCAALIILKVWFLSCRCILWPLRWTMLVNIIENFLKSIPSDMLIPILGNHIGHLLSVLSRK